MAPPTTSIEEQRKIKVVYGRVTFQKRQGDLTLGKPGISFSVTDDGAAPHFTARFRWNSIQKYVVNKSKPMIKVKILGKDGDEQGLLFTMDNRDELEALTDDLEARLAPPEERVSVVAAPAVPEEEVEDSPPYMNTYSMEKRTLALVPMPPQIKIEEEVAVAEPIQQRAMVRGRDGDDMTICTTTTVAYDDAVNTNGDIHGTSRYLSPTTGAQLIAEAEFTDFAPNPCVCLGCCVPDEQRKRTYVRVFENRVEANIPRNPWCCPDERCVVDSTRILFFDKAPNRIGMYCNLIPCVCCGPPVIYSKVPKMCCGLIDLRPCYGESIMHAGCDCFHLRCCLCCGPFCFQSWACPLFGSIKNGPEFLAKWKGALAAYQEKHSIDETQRAIFYHVEDGCCATDSCKPIEAARMER